MLLSIPLYKYIECIGLIILDIFILLIVLSWLLFSVYLVANTLLMKDRDNKFFIIVLIFTLIILYAAGRSCACLLSDTIPYIKSIIGQI